MPVSPSNSRTRQTQVFYWTNKTYQRCWLWSFVSCRRPPSRSTCTVRHRTGTGRGCWVTAAPRRSAVWTCWRSRSDEQRPWWRAPCRQAGPRSGCQSEESYSPKLRCSPEQPKWHHHQRLRERQRERREQENSLPFYTAFFSQNKTTLDYSITQSDLDLNMGGEVLSCYSCLVRRGEMGWMTNSYSKFIKSLNFLGNGKTTEQLSLLISSEIIFGPLGNYYCINWM